MTANTDDLHVRIRRVAAVVRWLALAGMVAIAVVSAYVAVTHSLEFQSRTAWRGVSVLTQGSQDLPASVARSPWAPYLDLLSNCVLLWGLWQLVRLMRACERGELFSSQVAGYLQRFSAAIIVSELLQISLPMQIALLSRLLGQEHTGVVLTISSSALWTLLIASVFLVLAWMLRAAAEIAEDNASIV
jgi:hypothetical protein